MNMKKRGPRSPSLKERSSTDTAPLERSEAQSLLERCEQNATDLTKKEDRLRQSVYEFLIRGGPAALGIDEATVRKRICEKSGSHRSAVSRQYLAGYMDYSLNLPPGEVKEYVLRELRTNVQRKSCGDVLDKALEKKGSYRKITARVALEVAEELGYLKQRPASEAGGTKATCLSDDSQQGDLEISAEPSPIASQHSKVPKKIGQNRSDTDSLDAIKASSPIGSLVAKLCKNKRDRNFVRQYLETSNTDPDLIKELESLSLEQRHNALKIIKKY